MQNTSTSFWVDRFKASGIHLSISLALALLAALLVFGVWYPYPYREISGGRDLFFLVVTVDVILGPLITLAVFDRRKPRKELWRDMSVVALLQLGALCYGLWSVFLARPVHLVFEYDRFHVVHAVDIPVGLTAMAPAGLNTLPLMGPTVLSLRPFKSSLEKMKAAQAELDGLSVSAQPEFWQAYEAATPQVLAAAKPISALKLRFPASIGDIDRVSKSTARPIDSLVYLPMVGRRSYWTVLLDRESAAVLAFIPLDSF
jgi:uncharacterized iron-regulated membrane protein